MAISFLQKKNTLFVFPPVQYLNAIPRGRSEGAEAENASSALIKMCFFCRDLRGCAPCEQSFGSWMAAILKTVVYLLLGFTDCQLRSSAAVMESRLVRIFISVV